ncbi:hypothetical protein EJB05_47960, partial [Eragrostis curvula]
MDVEELQKKLRALEAGQAELKREVSKLMRTEATGALCQQFVGALSRPAPPPPRSSSRTNHQRLGRAGLSVRHHKLILQSLGQAVHVLDLQGNILYWNRNAEHLYGYSASEAIGQNVARLLVDPRDIPPLRALIEDIFTGKCWRGKFPVKKKSGERFFVLADGTPLHDDDGSVIGLICVSADLRVLKEIIGFSPFVGHWNFSPKN